MDLEKIKAKLEQEIKELKHDLSELEEEREALSEVEVTESSDAALRYEMQEDYHLMKEKLSARLKQVERALAKIKEDNYGICDQCQNAIEEGRLDLDPATTFCRSCAINKKK